MSINVYSDDNGKVFFERDLTGILTELLIATKAVTGGEIITEPEDGTIAKRVAEIKVYAVDDDQEFTVQHNKTQKAVKEDVDRKPDGDAGSWAVQSLIFSKDEFETVVECKAWIDDNDEYGDFGVDETDNSFRYRQYDPKHFDAYKIISLGTGVSGVHGRIAEVEQSEEDSEEKLKIAHQKHKAIKEVNLAIAAKGLMFLTSTTRVAKSDDGEEEERYVLALVLEPTDGKNGALYRPDTQKDVYSAKTVRDTAHGWMENSGAIDLMHNWEALSKNEVAILECYVAPCELNFGEGDNVNKIQEGTWMLALRIKNDVLWAAVKTGDLGAYSIGGIANRKPFEAEE